MSKQYLLLGTFGSDLAHAGETHDSHEEAHRHQATEESESAQQPTREADNAADTRTIQDSTGQQVGFEPPIVHSEIVTSLIVIALAAGVFGLSYLLKAPFFVRFVASILTLILLGALYFVVAPTVTAVAAGLGFFVSLVITFLALSAQ